VSKSSIVHRSHLQDLAATRDGVSCFWTGRGPHHTFAASLFPAISAAVWGVKVSLRETEIGNQVRHTWLTVPALISDVLSQAVRGSTLSRAASFGSFLIDLFACLLDARTLLLDADTPLLCDFAAVHAEDKHQETAADSGLACNGPEKLRHECHADLFGQ
jgi:hypothetical protein